MYDIGKYLGFANLKPNVRFKCIILAVTEADGSESVQRSEYYSRFVQPRISVRFG